MTMQVLTIKDLALSTDLDSAAMRDVRGGTGYGAMPSFAMPSFAPSLSVTKNDFNFAATQGLGQSQNTEVNNGNNAAFVCGITSNVHPTQNGSNNISIG
jgi:hypothetical protein